MTSCQYFLPTRIIFGPGSLSRLKEIVFQFKPRKILFVSGEHLKKDGTIKKLRDSFRKNALVYRQKISKSDTDSVDKLAYFCRKEKPDLIIGLGGGTVLDTAKSAAILINNFGSVKDYVVKKKVINSRGVSFIAIPTTSGTGSEVTPWATIWDLKNKKKYSLSSPLMFAKIAIIDPNLTLNLPPNITASTGMDALAQAIEAYWSKNHNPISDALSLKAIKLILENLEEAVRRPNIKNREAMSLGSLLSGMAFSNTKSTICHSVSYPMTAHFGIPHGHAVALTLPSFLEYSFGEIEAERKKPLLEAIGELNVHSAAQRLSLLMKKIGLATRLSELGIKKQDLDLIVREGFMPNRADNAPKIPTQEELKKILMKIF